MRTPKVRPENGKCAKNQAKGRKNQPFPCENRQFQRLDFWQSELFSVSLDELERYTVTHFTAEEAFMRSHGYSNFEAHKKQHDQFISRVRSERQSIEAGGPVSLDMINFLKDWLINHILVQDKAYAAEFKNKKLGVLGGFFSRLLRI